MIYLTNGCVGAKQQSLNHSLSCWCPLVFMVWDFNSINWLTFKNWQCKTSDTCKKLHSHPSRTYRPSGLFFDKQSCDSYHDFLYKELLLTRKLLNKGLLEVKLKSSRRKYLGSPPVYGGVRVDHSFSFLWYYFAFPVSCVPNVASFYVFFILDPPFDFL